MPEGPPDSRELARRIERAQAEQLHRTGPGTNLAVAGGRAVFKGPGSPFSAALGLGLGGPVSAGEIDRLEAHLAPEGGTVRAEVTPFADPTLAAELGRRGYRLERFYQVWWRAPPPPPPAAEGPEVRPIRPGEERAWVDVFSQAFLGRSPSVAAAEAMLEMTRAPGNVCFAAFESGELRAVAIASASGGVAILSGAGVPAPARGRGWQAALVRERLAWAAAQGCDVAASATEPGTASQRTLEKAGFRCAYPKAVLVRDLSGPAAGPGGDRSG